MMLTSLSASRSSDLGCHHEAASRKDSSSCKIRARHSALSEASPCDMARERPYHSSDVITHQAGLPLRLVLASNWLPCFERARFSASLSPLLLLLLPSADTFRLLERPRRTLNERMGTVDTVVVTGPAPGRVWNARCGSSKPLMFAVVYDSRVFVSV
jgi:hypothetical protein